MIPSDPTVTSPLRTVIYTRALTRVARRIQHRFILEAFAAGQFPLLKFVEPGYVEAQRDGVVVEQLVAAAAEGEFDAVICYDVQRLSRESLAAAIDIVNRLLLLDVRVFTVTRGELTANTLLQVSEPDHE